MAVPARAVATVEQAMSGQFPFCMPSTGLAQAARMMAANRVHELPVIVDQRSLGYISYLDILQRFVRGLLEGRAVEIIRTPLPEVRPDTPLDQAVRIMQDTGRQLVLVTTSEGMPLGALSVKDVTRAMAA